MVDVALSLWITEDLLTMALVGAGIAVTQTAGADDRVAKPDSND